MALDVSPPPARPRVLLISQDLVGPRMAGTGIRCWELARVLSAACDVTLAAPLDASPVAPTPFRLAGLTLEAPGELEALLAEADVVVSSPLLLRDYPGLATLPVPWVVDAYVPSPTESLALNRHWDLAERLHGHTADVELLNRALAAADLVLCASDRQRDLYLGALAAVGRLNPHLYDEDVTLGNLVAVVPYGLPATPPAGGTPLLKGVHPAVAREDKVIVWGGGIWNWFDPLTLLRALERVLRVRQDVRLYFPGTRHPFDRRVPEMRMRLETLALCDEARLTDRYVIFGDWVPYAERSRYLLEADVGASLHLAGIEARYAYRTRVLDYFWAGLPALLSEGDVLADLAQARGVGLRVPAGDAEAAAEALLDLLRWERGAAELRGRFAALAEELSWERAAAPLVAFCRVPRLAADKRAGYSVRQGLLLAERQRLEALEALVQGYERGRVMRLLNALHGLRRRLGGARGRGDA